jgi:hypothetical protein
MSHAIGLHPVVVLASVLVGIKVAGIAGAIFALPFAAVMAAFLKHFLSRRGHLPGDVATRAAQRVGEREGRAVRVPKPPPIAGSGGAPGGPVPSEIPADQSA